MSVYLTRKFWEQTFERAFKTTAEVAASVLSVSAVVQDVDWALVGGSTAMATLLSLLFSIGSARIGADDSPSLV